MESKQEIKVLVVDDMITNRILLTSILEPEGFSVYEAADGHSALRMMQQERPDIILMDIVSPDIDGITCCRMISNEPSYRGAKMIMVTSEGDYQRIREAFSAGCSDYITKPVKPDELLNKLDEMVHFIEASRTLGYINA